MPYLEKASEVSPFARGVEKTHPRVVELLPHNGSLDAKYDLNRVGCGIDDEDHDELSILCLQISRMNHSCACKSLG